MCIRDSPAPLRPRTKPPVLHDRVQPESKTATVYISDVYLNEDRSSILQPLVNASVVTTRMDGLSLIHI